MIETRLLMENKFCFNQPFDLERDERIVENLNLDWSLNPFGDQEWTFMLNRMEYLILLDSNIENQKEKIKQLVLNWITNVDLESCFVRTIDTAIRLGAWLDVVECFEHDEYGTVITSIQKQIDYLESNWQDRYLLLNWGIIQTCSLLEVDSRLDEVTIDFNTHITRLKQMLHIQFSKNGFHNEASTMYLIEVVKQLNKVVNIPGCEFVSPVLAKAKATLVNLKLKSGYLAPIGDSDFHLINEIFDDLKMENIKPANNIEDGVIHLYRGQFEVMLFNTKHGGGHGHLMNNHIELCVDKKPVFTDSGRYTYTEDKIRKVLKDFECHNTISVQNSNCLPINSWKTSGYKCVFPIEYYQSEEDDIVISSWTDTVNIYYRCLWLQAGGVVVIDYTNTSYSQIFNCDSELVISNNEFVINDRQYTVLSSNGYELNSGVQSKVYNQIASTKRIETSRSTGFQVTAVSEQENLLKIEKIFNVKGVEVENYRGINYGGKTLIVSFIENLQASIPYYYQKQPFNFQLGLYNNKSFNVLKT